MYKSFLLEKLSGRRRRKKDRNLNLNVEYSSRKSLTEEDEDTKVVSIDSFFFFSLKKKRKRKNRKNRFFFKDTECSAGLTKASTIAFNKQAVIASIQHANGAALNVVSFNLARNYKRNAKATICRENKKRCTYYISHCMY